MLKLFLHAGVFHADDVMCAALMAKVDPDIRISRVLQVPEILDEDTIVADIGGGKYDHHQVDAALRPDGNKRAACGLLFADYWDRIFPDRRSARQFERSFIIPIEDQDNGLCRNPFSDAIKSFNPAWDDDKSENECFCEAVSFVSEVLDMQIDRALATARAVDLVEDVYEQAPDKRVVILPRFAPWQSVLNRRETVYVIFPSNRGGYVLQAVPDSNAGSFVVKAPFPESWLTTRPQGCTFVHQGRSIASFGTETEALEAAKALLDN